MKKIVLVFIFILGAINLYAQIDFFNDKIYKANINSKKALQMQKDGALIIDVRTKGEFNELRAKDSVNIPIFFAQNGQRVLNRNFVIDVKKFVKDDTNKEIILICRSGSRTKFASNILTYEGFKNIYNIQEGFVYDWIKEKLPVER